MENYYEVLSVNSSATEDEIRRAYRILARRYHPDVNPGKVNSDKFRKIAEAYETLNDSEKRRQYDIELESSQRKQFNQRYKGYASTSSQGTTTPRGTATDRYYEAQKADYEKIRKMQAKHAATAATQVRTPKPGTLPDLKALYGQVRKGAKSFLKYAAYKPKDESKPKGRKVQVSKISIIEVSITMHDVINGIRKTVEIQDDNTSRKINVRIPPAVKNGSIIRMRANNLPGEEIVLIIRIAKHPMLSIESKGLILEIPVTVNEAISGSNIKIPTLEDPVMLKIPPNTHGGTDFRLRGKGIKNKEGDGDLFARVTIRVPESAHAVGIKEKAAELDEYYENPVRKELPKSLLEF